MTQVFRPYYKCYRCGKAILSIENEIHCGSFSLVLCEDCKENITEGLGK